MQGVLRGLLYVRRNQRTAMTNDTPPTIASTMTAYTGFRQHPCEIPLTEFCSIVAATRASKAGGGAGAQAVCAEWAGRRCAAPGY